jgi:tetratricopeptide (TPR) repeat protein
MRIWTYTAVFLVFGVVGQGARPTRAAVEDDVDRVVVAAVLIGDGHYDRALTVLKELDPAEEVKRDKTFDVARYWRLRGLCHLQLGAAAEAIGDFERALAAGEANPELHLRIAQAHGQLGAHEQALASLDRAGAAATAVPGGFMLRARSLVALNRHSEAWDVLQAGRAAFPDDVGFDRESLYLLIQLGLYQEARVVGQRYLARQQGEPSAWLAVGEALRRSGNLEEAAAHLEATRVRFPTEIDAYTLLAKTYVDRGLPGACGTVLQTAAILDPNLAAAAADCLRDAGQLERALYLNSVVPDPTLKARQRLDLLVRSQSWDRAIAHLPRVERLGLLDEDPVAYAAAYSLYQVGRYGEAETVLKRIDDPRLFQDATALRKAMADCEANPGGCL